MTTTAEAIERVKAALVARERAKGDPERLWQTAYWGFIDAANPDAISAILASHAALLEALRPYEHDTKANARAIQSATQSTKESTNG